MKQYNKNPFYFTIDMEFFWKQLLGRHAIYAGNRIVFKNPCSSIFLHKYDILLQELYQPSLSQQRNWQGILGKPKPGYLLDVSLLIEYACGFISGTRKSSSWPEVQFYCLRCRIFFFLWFFIINCFCCCCCLLSFGFCFLCKWRRRKHGIRRFPKLNFKLWIR